VRREAALQGLDDRGPLVARPGMEPVGQPLGVGLPGHQARQDGSPARADDPGEDRGELEVRALEQLVDALRMRRTSCLRVRVSSRRTCWGAG
jgi:hypothetical protein